MCVIQTEIKGIFHVEINFWYVLAYLKARCRCLCLRSSFNFDIRSNRSCLSVI